MYAIETIPDGDDVCRLIDRPRMQTAIDEGLLWHQIFEFPSNKADKRVQLPESLVWTKHAPAPDAVHALGCQRQREKRITKPSFAYAGYIATTAGRVRETRNARGHGMYLEHEPGQGIYHAHVGYAPAPGLPFEKNDRNELKVLLQKIFGPLVAHTCAE